MGISRYIRMTFFQDIKKNLFYMLVLILSIVLIFNIFNIVFNENITAFKSDSYRSISTLGFIIMVVSAIFTFFANSYYMEDKYKEYAIVSISGRSLVDICKMVIIRSSIVTIISIGIGCVLGVITAPLVLGFLCSLVGITTDTSVIPQNAIVTTVLLMFIELEVVFLLNVGSIYRSSIKDLVSKKKSVMLKDRRQVKVPTAIYIILYVLPIVAALLPTSAEEKVQFVRLGTALGVVGVFGIIRYVIPNYLEKYRKNKLIIDKYKLIEISNLYTSIEKSIILMLALVISVTLSLTVGAGYSIGSIINTMSLLCYGVIILTMSFTVVYKFLIEAKVRKNNFMQLRLLGYTTDEIKKIILNEVIIFYSIFISLGLIYILMITVTSVAAGLISLIAGIVIIAFYLGIFILTGIISYLGYKKIALK